MPARQLPTGTIQVDPPVRETGVTVAYCRVPSHDQTADLRFGVEHLEAALAAYGRTVIVLDDAELPDDLARDLTEVLTSMCARQYGRRSPSRRVAAAVIAIQNEPDEAPGDPS